MSDCTFWNVGQLGLLTFEEANRALRSVAEGRDDIYRFLLGKKAGTDKPLVVPALEPGRRTRAWGLYWRGRTDQGAVNRQFVFPIIPPKWDLWEAVHVSEWRVVWCGGTLEDVFGLNFRMMPGDFRFSSNQANIALLQFNKVDPQGLYQYVVPVEVVQIGEDGWLAQPDGWSME